MQKYGKTISFLCMLDEFDAWKYASDIHHMSFSGWARLKLNVAARAEADEELRRIRELGKSGASKKAPQAQPMLPGHKMLGVMTADEIALYQRTYQKYDMRLKTPIECDTLASEAVTAQRQLQIVPAKIEPEQTPEELDAEATFVRGGNNSQFPSVDEPDPNDLSYLDDD